MTEPSGRVLDWLLALWIVAAGAAFVFAPLELWAGGRYVYTAVLAACMVSLGLSVLKQASPHDS